MSFRTKSDSSESGEICSSTEKTCKNTYKSSNTYFSGSYSATVKAQSAVWEATSDPFEFTPSDISKYHIVIFVDFSQWCPFGFKSACFCILTCCHVHIPPVKIPHPKWSSVTLSSDQLLVKWKIWPYASNYKYHCQVKYSKVRPSLIFFNLILSWSIYWKRPGDSVESQATIFMLGVTNQKKTTVVNCVYLTVNMTPTRRFLENFFCCCHCYFLLLFF